jgi:cytoskeletal protein RodZ
MKMSNNTKWVVGVIVVIVIVAILWYAFGQRNETATNETPATGSSTEQTAPAPTTDGGTTGGTTNGTSGTSGTGPTQ